MRQASRKAGHIRRANASEPADWQEPHSPSEHGKILIGQHVGAGGKIERMYRSTARRRISEARLWGAMTGDEQEAAVRIVRGLEIITTGLGMRAASLVRVDKSTADPSKRDMRLVEAYWSWAKLAQRRKISVAYTLDILADGKSCNQVDQERRHRKGTARANLFDALAVYCELQGWRVAGK